MVTAKTIDPEGVYLQSPRDRHWRTVPCCPNSKRSIA